MIGIVDADGTTESHAVKFDKAGGDAVKLEVFDNDADIFEDVKLEADVADAGREIFGRLVKCCGFGIEE